MKVILPIVVTLIMITLFVREYQMDKQMVIDNCFASQKAAESYADQNGGIYPETVDTDSLDSGKTVIDLLPNSKRLWNAYTDKLSEPINGQAFSRGQVGYLPVKTDSVNTGCRITGVGRKQGEIIITLTSGRCK